MPSHAAPSHRMLVYAAAYVPLQGLEKKEINELIKAIDVNDDGEISRSEWETAWIEALGTLDEESRQRLESTVHKSVSSRSLLSEGGSVEMHTLAERSN